VYDTEEAADGEGSARTTRSKSRRIAASQESHPEAIEIEDSEGEEDDYRPDTPPSDGLVECPLQCGKRMKEEEVFVHLDRCEDEKKQRYKKQAQAPANPFGTSRQPQSQDTRPQDRINELNYSMLKDNALTKKLKEAGIPSGGGRQVMINRHREWVNIWNANCDSTRPRTKRELLHDLDVWDRTQGGKAPSAQGLSSTIMRKDFDGDAYSKRHQDDFSRLIADAKRKKSIPAPGDSASKDVEMAMENAGTGQEPSTPQKDHNSKADPPADHDSAMPYADNPRALSAVREKVHDINLGHTGEPATNADFAISHSIPSSSQSRPQKSEQNPPSIFNEMIGTPGQSDFDRSGSASNPPATSQPPVPRLVHHTSRHEHGPYSETCDIPTHLLQPGEAKKLPMFEVPAQPVSDLDGGASSVGI
jgi:E3 ubiquitin-protein ligase RAD18